MSTVSVESKEWCPIVLHTASAVTRPRRPLWWYCSVNQTHVNVGSNRTGQPRGKQFVVLSSSLFSPHSFHCLSPFFPTYCWPSISWLPRPLWKATVIQDKIKCSVRLFGGGCTYYLFLWLLLVYFGGRKEMDLHLISLSSFGDDDQPQWPSGNVQLAV